MTRLILLAATLAIVPACSSAPAPSAEPETRIIYLEHLRSSDLLTALNDLGLPDGLKIMPHGETNSVAIQGNEERVNQTMNLIAHLDKPTR